MTIITASSATASQREKVYSNLIWTCIDLNVLRTEKRRYDSGIDQYVLRTEDTEL